MPAHVYEKKVVILQAFSRERDEYTHVRINKNMFGHAENKHKEHLLTKLINKQQNAYNSTIS